MEIASLGGEVVGPREPKDPDGRVLRFTVADVAACLEGAKAGEFDDLV